jgi:hypothetical protein
LLDQAHQDIVALVRRWKLVANFFQLERNGSCILHLCHIVNVSLGLNFVQRGDPPIRSALSFLIACNLWASAWCESSRGCPLRTRAWRIEPALRIVVNFM